MPGGSSIQIDTLPATDAACHAGLEDEVDYHTWTLLKGIAMSTLLGVGTQATFGSNQSNLVEAIRQSTQESTNRAGSRIVEKDLNIQPIPRGDAWEARSGGDSPKDYLRVRLDDSCLPEPINAALFPSEDGAEAQLVWNRR